MLVAHEPDEDPRIRWVSDLCVDVASTSMAALVPGSDEVRAEQRGALLVERFSPDPYLKRWEREVFHRGRFVARARHWVAWWFSWFVARLRGHLLSPLARRLRELLTNDVPRSPEKRQRAAQHERVPGADRAEAVGDSNGRSKAESSRRWRTRLTRRWDDSSARRVFDVWKFLHLTTGALYRHSRTAAAAPQLIVAHDIFTLFAAVKLRRVYGSRVIYDSHELWSEELGIDLGCFGKALVRRAEAAAMRKADVVVAVTPQIADYYATHYGVPDAIAVPNAEPLRKPRPSVRSTGDAGPVTFLFQGRAGEGRGLRRLVRAWMEIGVDDARLVLRCLPDETLSAIRDAFEDEIRKGRVEFSKPVGPDELVEAASQAQVGIIPYPGPNLNHVYACPNKFSQYMQAGLAILHNADQEYVSDIVSSAHCGLAFELDDVDSLRRAVRSLVEDRSEMERMRRRSQEFAYETFNWSVQSTLYRDAIERSLGVRRAR